MKNGIVKLAKEAKEATAVLGIVDAAKKNRALVSAAKDLRKESAYILKENEKDLRAARKKKLSAALIDRLCLTRERIESMAKSLEEVAGLNDPVGNLYDMKKRPNGLLLGKMRVPIGVICIIFEARPNVTSDAASLCLKSGNAVILRGGRDAIKSNSAIHKVLVEALMKEGLPKAAITLIKDTTHKSVSVLLKQTKYIDLVIPRGGEGLIRAVCRDSKIPVIKHYKGVCHVYVDEEADLNMAERICFNAKVQRPGVCNAMETMLVHKHAAARFLPGMIKKFRDADVEIRGCALTRRIVKGLKAAKETDWYAEYLDLVLAVKVVNSMQEAIKHIAKYGSMHSDSIVTDNYGNGMEFIRKVDSSSVFINASTRFSDGGQYGMGAEIGISTDKLHARGPMGLEDLTTYKYVVFGNGQIRK